MAGVICQQNDQEFDWFINILQREKVRSYLEIGSKWGGSLLRVAEALPVPSRLVSVDLCESGSAVSASLNEVVARINAMGHDAYLVVGDSAHRKTAKAARRLGPYGACFIDGNHTLSYLRNDFDNYAPVSRIVAFHDIGWKPKENGPSIDAPQFWQSIKTSYPHEEINLNDRKNGIGVLWVERDISLQVAPYTKTSRERRAAMISALNLIDAQKIEGDIVECGVWRGGNIMLARYLSPKRTCWLYDTFSGMTEPGPEDKSKSGRMAIDGYQARKDIGQNWCDVSVDEVKDALRATDTFDEEKIRFVVGDVLDTLTLTENLPERISLLRLDTDWYASTKMELEVLYPRLVPGGILIVDDYGHWQGARQAVDEYFVGQNVEIKQIDYTGIMMVKPCQN